MCVFVGAFCVCVYVVCVLCCFVCCEFRGGGTIRIQSHTDFILYKTLPELKQKLIKTTKHK